MIRKKFSASVGFSFLVLYILFTYTPQVFIHLTITDELSDLFHGAESSILFALIPIILFLILVVLTDKIKPRIKKFSLPLRYIKYFNLISLFLSLLFLVSSLKFFYDFNISFRHNQRLRDAGILIQIMFFLMMTSRYYIFLMILKVLRKENLNKINIMTLIIIVVATLLSLNSSTNVLTIAILLILLFKKSLFTSRTSIKKIFLISLFVPIAAILVLFLGHANKTGFESALETFSNADNYYDILVHLSKRVSTSYMSLINMASNHMFDIELQVDTIYSSYNSFLRKLAVIFPFIESSSEGISSLNRTNFLVLFKPYNDHSGASPGLIASIFYIPFLPLGVMCIVFYTTIITGAINRYTQNINNINLVSLVILFYVNFVLIESPLSMFEIINPVVLYFLLFYFGSYVNVNRFQGNTHA